MEGGVICVSLDGSFIKYHQREVSLDTRRGGLYCVNIEVLCLSMTFSLAQAHTTILSNLYVYCTFHFKINPFVSIMYIYFEVFMYTLYIFSYIYIHTFVIYVKVLCILIG